MLNLSEENGKKKKAIRCPQCSNYVNIEQKKNGALCGNCHICKITFYIKQHSEKERLIRIIQH